MLVLYNTRIIKVTDRFRRTVIFATLGIMALYLVSFVISLFGAEIPFINEPSLFGILFSVFVCGIAAMNLALDFDFIERGSKAGLAKDYEWVAAVGLLVTIVWLYLEILRLLVEAASELITESAATAVRRRRCSPAPRGRWSGSAGLLRSSAPSTGRSAVARHVRLASSRRAGVRPRLDVGVADDGGGPRHPRRGAVQRGRGGYIVELSRRANRHVYAAGFVCVRASWSRSATP